MFVMIPGHRGECLSSDESGKLELKWQMSSTRRDSSRENEMECMSITTLDSQSGSMLNSFERESEQFWLPKQVTR